MRKREPISPRYAGTAVVVLALAAVAFPTGAEAANTRVSIFNYAWSQPEVHVDLGEKVTWDWLGPDLAHSVTGISPNDLQWDSDPGTDAPAHRAGDSYTLQFTEPGEYFFQCKLHAVVRGEVIVSDVPGDPNSDPGPQPPLNLDLKAPTLGSMTLTKQKVRGPNGIAFSAQISERGSLDAEYYRFNSKGRRVYNGFKTWRAFIGVNHLRLGARWKHFRARPGRYLAILKATDEAANESKPLRKRFTIVG
jgi:plastocyanin